MDLRSFSIFLAFFVAYGALTSKNYTRELNNKYSNVARTNLLYMGGIINKAQYDRQLSNIDMPEITAKNEKEEIFKKCSRF